MRSSEAPPQTFSAVKRSLRELADAQRAQHSQRFFKTGAGEYAEGDIFWGITVPQQRVVARRFRDLPKGQIDRLIQTSAHECRLTAILILVDQFQRSREPDEREQIYKFVLQRTKFINNWDLVDSIAPKIIGEYLVDRSDRKILDKLSRSKDLWEQRMAMVASLALIRRGEFDWTLKLAERYLNHPHDLIHKAAGWMLREVGRRNPTVLQAFLDQHATVMPRTMLRYAIEKLSPSQRRQYMQRDP
jgi:3-methyladenine DNA glycosylase AlkD